LCRNPTAWVKPLTELKLRRSTLPAAFLSDGLYDLGLWLLRALFPPSYSACSRSLLADWGHPGHSAASGVEATERDIFFQASAIVVFRSDRCWRTIAARPIFLDCEIGLAYLSARPLRTCLPPSCQIIGDAEEYLIRRMIGYGTCATSFRLIWRFIVTGAMPTF
jgi:hypothetical protein